MPDLGGMGGFGGGKGKSCPLYKCSKGFEPAPTRPLKYSASGCSGMGGGMVMSMGKSEDGPVEDCCSRRTACFQTCGASKATCEKEFDKCTKDACASLEDDPEAKKECDSSASLQVMMAGFGDCKEFNAAQAKGCKCLSPEKAVAQREKTLTDFYKKHAPNDVGKVKGLVGKSGDDPKKFAALLNKLVAKYPAAIKIKRSEQQDYMDNLMKESREKKDTDGNGAEDGGDGAAESGDTEVPEEELKPEAASGAKRKRSKGKGSPDKDDAVDDLDALLKEEL